MDFTSWGFIGLFFASFLSATILPFSSEVVLVYFLNQNVNPWICLSIVTAGNSLGGLTNYGLGTLGNLKWLKRIGVSEASILAQERWVVRFGSWIALFSWVPIIGDPLLVALGYYRSPLWITLILMFLGKFLRYWLIIIIFT
jgi:membrane protein YqaA with SNARE-associated domain